MTKITPLLLLFTLLPLLRPAPLTLLPSVEQFHTLSNPKKVNLLHFILTLPEKLPDVDLSVMVRPLDDQSDPDIFISTKNEAPDSFSNSDIACTSSGLDICTIGERNITSGIVFYIGVKCFSECSFSIKAEYSHSGYFSLSLNPNANTMEGIYSLEFDSNAAKTLKFNIPANLLNLERILIKTQLTSVSLLNETFSIYLKEGNTPPTTSRYDHKGMESWNEGQSILLSKEEDGEAGLFCNSGCNYTLLLHGPEDAKIRIIVQGYNNIVKTKLNQNLQDMVFRDQNITYELNVDSTVSYLSPFKDVNLILTLTVYSGNPDLYVHYDQLPRKLEKYQWKSTENIKESLIITAKEREALDCSNSKFYITVYGKSTSTFSLWIGTSLNFAYLGFGVAQTGSVINNEIINYRLFLPNNYDNMNITLTLNANSGNPDLYIKRCILNDTDNDWKRAREEREKCKLSADDIKNRYVTGFKPKGADFFLFSDNVGGKDFVKFFHNAADCVKMEGVSSFNVNKCFYVVGIHGNSANSNESRYSLIASYNQAHLILAENTPLRSKGELGLYSYFKFNLPSNEGIDLLRFQITEISGRIAVYLSKKNRYPTSDSYEKAVFSHWGSLSYDPSEGNLEGNYYLGVLSETASTYSILPVVVRKGGKEGKETVTILYEGSPQHYSYVFKREEKYYFAFNVYRNESWTGGSDVFVHLTPIKGDFNMYVINIDMVDQKMKDPRPNKDFFHFKSNENGVLIRNTSANYKQNGKYLVYVEPKNQEEIENRIQEFVIQYSSWGSMKTLSTHHPFVDILGNDSFAYYRCEAHRGDESIEISINSKTYNPLYKTLMRVFFSFTSENPFPDEKKNDFTTVVQNNIWILVENSDLRTNCPFLFDDNKLNYTKQCVFYMSVRTYNFPLDINYGINIKRNVIERGGITDFVYNYLHDDTIADIQCNVSQKYGNMTFFIYKLQKSSQPIQISIRTQVYGSISFTLFGNIDSFSKIDSPLSLNKSFSKSKSESTFAEKFYYSLSTTIKPSLFKSKSCFSEKEGCGLFLTLVANQAFSPLNRSISIQVTQKILYISPGVPTKGFVEEGEIKYYLLKVNEDNTELVISVTPLDNGDPDLVVNRGRNSDWPTAYKSEWISNDVNGDQLKIKHKSSEADPDKNYYIVGVVGKKRCEFVLNVLSGNFRIREIYSNFPSDIILKKKEQTILVFHNFQNNLKEEGFRMIFSREYGDFAYAISLIRNKSDDYVDRIPSFSKKNYFISNLGQSEASAVNIEPSDPNYCVNCTYFVLIQAEKETALTFLLASGKEGVFLQHGRSFKDWVESKKTNVYYSDFYYEVKKVTINVIVYQGRVKVYVAPIKEINLSNAEVTKINEKDNLINIEYDYTFNQKGPKEEHSSYKPNTIGILVEGLSSANYTISIRPEGRQRTLKYGIHEYLPLVYGEAQYLNFHSHSEFSEDRHFSLSLTGLSGYMNSSTEVLEFEFSLKENKKDQMTKLESSKYSIERSVEGYFINIRALRGDFEVKVSLKEKKFNGWIYVLLNFDGIDTVSPDHTYFGKLQGGRTQFYQLLTQQHEKVLVEVFQCAGRVKVIASGTQENALNHINDLKNELDSPLASESHHISLYTTQSSKLAISNVFLGIRYLEGYVNKSDKGAQKESAKYVLRTHFLSSLIETPYEVFFPGGEGAVFYNLKGGYFNFYASPLICEGGCKDRLTNSLKKKIKSMKYYIAISDDNLYADAFTKCGVLKETMKSLLYQEINLNSPSEEVQVNFPFKEDLFLDNHDYYVKIVASVEVQEAYNNQPYTFFYKTLQFYPGYLAGGKEEGGALPWILTIVLIAFFLAVGIACWVFRRYKMVEKQLNYELQDVRNVAGIKDMTGMGTLMTDN